MRWSGGRPRPPGSRDAHSPLNYAFATSTGSIITYLPIEPRSLKMMRPVILAKSVSSLPRPTLRPGFTRVPRWRTMMVPPGTTCPPKALKPSRCEFESRPFRDVPCPFLCAMDESLVPQFLEPVVGCRSLVVGQKPCEHASVADAGTTRAYFFFAADFLAAVFFAAFFFAEALGAASFVSAAAFLGLGSFLGSAGALKDWPS